jgi:CBS domain-containing protein
MFRCVLAEAPFSTMPPPLARWCGGTRLATVAWECEAQELLLFAARHALPAIPSRAEPSRHGGVAAVLSRAEPRSSAGREFKGDIMLVRAIMKKDIATCEPDSDLNAVVALMRDHDCGFIPVVGREGEVVGVITDRDACLSACSKHRQPARISARETMSRPVFSCFADENLGEALAMMASHHVRRLPVIARGGRLEGVVSIDDFIRMADRPGAPTSADVVTALRTINEHRRIRPAHA